MEEIWKPILGYEGYYEVSNLGEIRSLDRWMKHSRVGFFSKKLGKIKEKVIDPKGCGYYYVGLYKNSVKKTFRVHRLVAKAFIPNPENKLYVNHIDNNGLNNKVENLEWCTAQENSHHMVKQGRSLTGETHPNSKLGIEQVREIKKSLLPKHQLAKSFNVSRRTIQLIQNGTNWSKVA